MILLVWSRYQTEIEKQQSKGKPHYLNFKYTFLIMELIEDRHFCIPSHKTVT